MPNFVFPPEAGGGGGGGGSVIFSATIIVSKNGSDATGTRNNWTKPFLTIQAAINAALPGDTICVMPGAYPESLTLQSNVEIGAFYRDSVTINDAKWSPGLGINLPQNPNEENIALTWLIFDGPLAVDTTAKTLNGTKCSVFSCKIGGAATFNGRGIGADELRFHDTDTDDSMTVISMEAVIQHSIPASLTVNGNGVAFVLAGAVPGGLTTNDTGTINAEAILCFGPVLANIGTKITARNSDLMSTVTASGTGVCDIRTSIYAPGALISIGGGMIDRSYSFFSFLSAPGPNLIAFGGISYTSPGYFVSLTPIGVAAFPLAYSVTGKTPGFFTMAEAGPGTFYDCLLIMP